jgi:uncharacterized delta-60 repeat protein
MNKIKLTPTRLFVAALFLCFSITLQIQAAPGELDPSFGVGGIVSLTNSLPTSANIHARAVAIQPDGKIVVAGSGYDGTNGGFGVARYNPDGSPDLTFGAGGKVVTIFPNGLAFASAVVIQSDGKIAAAGGNFYYYYGDDPPNYDFLLARYNSDGSLDSTFGTGGKVITTLSSPNSGANDIEIQPDGKIIAVGGAASGLTSDFLLIRYNTDGSLDNSFGTGGKVLNTFNSNASAIAVAIQSDGKIVAAGYTSSGTTAGSPSNFALARYNTDGSLDTSFDTDGKVTTSIGGIEDLATAVAIQSDGKIIAAGYSYNGTTTNFTLVRYNADGSLDSTFGTGGKVVTIFSNGSTGLARDIAIQSDGKIVAAGRSIRRNDDNTISGGIALVRYNIGGSLDTSFGASGIVVTTFSTEAWWAFYDAAAVIQSDGKIVVAGYIGPLSALFRYQGRTESGFTVTRSDDRNNAACAVGDCSLREAVGAANASGSDDTINFASGLTTITLTNEIVINNAGTLTINGLGANILTIDGGAGTNRIFYANNATVTISGITLTGGNGTGGGISGNGGAIYALEGFLTLDSVYVTGNTAIGYGGGVFNFFGNSNIINSTISDNTAVEGGGIGNILGFLTIVNSTIVSNTSTYSGGGIYTDSGNATLRNVTIANNTAQIGGGIYNDRSEYPLPALLNLGNTIVAGNIATNGIAPEIWSHSIAPVTSAGGNLIGDSPGDSANIPIVYQPTDIRDTNPLLGALSNNGGTTLTHALLAGSPIIDKGLNRLVSPLAPAFDQRGAGFARIRDGNGDNIATVDIGAFEVQLGSSTSGRTTPFDFDGDGRADLSVFRPSDQTWYLNRSQAGFSATQFGLSTDKITPADYDGDGKTDISVYRDGVWYWLNSSDYSFNTYQFGLTNDIPVPADYDGDGRAEPAVYRNGVWWTLNLANNQVKVVQFGLSTDKPVAADYDGDGRADQAVYRNGEWHLNRSTQGYTVVNFGLATDKPVIGDYDGDGQADEAVYRDGTWWILQSTQGTAVFQWGLPTDIPTPADYDGDGRTDAAVFRDGIWYVRQSNGGISIQQFGLANDNPLQSVYSP